MENTNNKKINLTQTVLFTVASILVLDSFVAPSIIGVSSITLWIFMAIVFFIPYGLLSAELGATYPDDGGIVSWVNRAFGEFPSVLVGWMYWINVAFWMPAVFTAFSGWLNLGVFPEMSMVVQAVIAVIMCWVVVFIGVRGIEESVLVSNIMAVLKMAILLIFGILGVVYAIRFGANHDFSTLKNWIPSWDNTLIYGAVIVYNLMGFELISAIGSKIKNPKRTIPLMTIIAGAAITFFYAFGTFGVLVALPAGEIDTLDGFVYALHELCSVFGSGQTVIFTILILASIITLVANMITWALGANESFMAADLDKRSKLLGHRHKKFGTADNLYYIMGIVSTILIILNYALSGDANDIFWTIFSFASIVFLANYLFMFPAALKLKYTDDTPRAYSVPGGKFGMWVAVILCFFFVALAIYFLIDWDFSSYPFWMQLIGTIITVFTGWLLYKAGKKKSVG
ncbi:MAG TPA: amino acid permease [Clostridiaceae bacterium]|nr:amino acid permease [Clostridiaceae bacterium]